MEVYPGNFRSIIDKSGVAEISRLAAVVLTRGYWFWCLEFLHELAELGGIGN